MIPGFKHAVWEIVPLVSWESLYDMMVHDKIDALWIMPNDPLSINITYDWFKDIPLSFSSYYPPENTYDGQPYILRLKRREPYGSPDRYLVFPAHMECCIPRQGDRGQWNLPSPDVLHTTLDYIENELGIPYIWTNGNVGEQYLRKCHENIKTHIRPLPKEQVEPFQEVLHGGMDRLVWRKLTRYANDDGKPELDLDDCLKKYIVGLDKNGQFIGSANAAYLGNGGFTYASKFDTNFVGFWQYEIYDVSNTPFNGYDLPCPLDVNRKWASTALINAALEVGVKVDIDCGIIWEQQGRYLQKWASNLWQHRINFRDSTRYPSWPARDNAERTMKAIPNSMVGRFMNEYSKEYHHPDWQLGIVHQAIASQVYTLRGLLNNHGLKPVLVNKDAFYVLTDDPQHLPEIDKYNQELRGFKKIGIAPLSDTIIEAFSEEKSTNKLESLIKKEMEAYEQSYL